MSIKEVVLILDRNICSAMQCFGVLLVYYFLTVLNKWIGMSIFYFQIVKKLLLF